MNNGDKPAYAHCMVDSNSGAHLIEPGLTKREMLAMNAPKIPGWFRFESKLPAPVAPSSWESMEDGDDKEACKAWQYDPCYDLPDHLQWYQQKWEKFWDEHRAKDYQKQSELYFAWRLYFADELLKHLDHGSNSI
jgi:hypothetical protein